MAFPARYPGKCQRCNGPIERGQLISWSRRPGKKFIYHADCSNPTGPQTPPSVPAVVETEPVTEPASAPTVVIGQAQECDSETMPATVEQAQAAAPSGDFMGLLVAAVAARIPQPKQAIDSAEVKRIIQATLADTVTVTVKVERRDAPTVEIKTAHERFPQLLYHLANREHCYLFGPHGSGKSTAAEQAAEALGIPYGYISLTPQTPESRLLGFMDATGTYRGTQFRKCYEHGGVFCIDELDNSAPSLLTTLNGALENGHMAFPDAIVPRHKDFVMVGTGNTSGRGANPAYPERRPFDRAFADRFAFINWQYDEKLERKLALAINPTARDLVYWVQSVRKWTEKNLPKFTPSPRVTFRLCAYLRDGKLDPDTAVDTAYFGGDTEARNKVLANFPLPTFADRTEAA